MNKTIGIILREFKSNSNIELLGLRADLITYLRKYKIRLITIPISYQNNKYDELEKVLDIINFCHGIIFPGGSREEELDLQIINYLYIHNIPTLGLCLGAQEMALSFVGCLDQLSSHNHQSQKDYVHKVKIKTNKV